ncbi:MAG: hypothetical protein WCX17_02505 [Parcubacteria group bacterium]|jgi:hypothetical protein
MKITNKIFDYEIAMCRKLYKKTRGCQWGKCKDCGVVPLLYKLHSGLLVDKKKDVAKLKKAYLK